MTAGDGIQERARPLGISVLAVWSGIGCAIGIAVTLLAIGGGATVRGGPLALVVVPGLIIAAGATALGLWELRWWAWPLALLAWIAAAVGALVGLTNGRLNTDLVVAPIAIAYLLRGDVRAAFGPSIVSPARRFILVTATLAVVLAALPVGGAVAAGWSPTVPDDAGSTLAAQIDVARLIAPGPTSSKPDEATFAGSECLDRDQRPAGWLDLCWSVVRQPDGDPDGDYYRFEAHGTFGSEATDPGQPAGSGIRWIVLRNRLLTSIVDGVASARPDGVVEGCQGGDVGELMLLGARSPELPCDGRIIGRADLQTHTVTWTCVGCLLPDSGDRAIGLSEDVKVGEGLAPAWMVYADFGN
jgi:hypothetical protein